MKYYPNGIMRQARAENIVAAPQCSKCRWAKKLKVLKLEADHKESERK